MCEPHWKSMIYKAEAFLYGPQSFKERKAKPFLAFCAAWVFPLSQRGRRHNCPNGGVNNSPCIPKESHQQQKYKRGNGDQWATDTSVNMAESLQPLRPVKSPDIHKACSNGPTNSFSLGVKSDPSSSLSGLTLILRELFLIEQEAAS